MKYPRPVYPGQRKSEGDEKPAFGFNMPELPKFDLPITPLENFKRSAARKNPLWVPAALTDFQDLRIQDIADGEYPLGPDFNKRVTEDYTFIDWFGVQWTWVCSAGGACTTPGVNLIEDITDWESVIKFPELEKWDWKTKADAFMKNRYDPQKVLHIDIGPGCIQRLISVLGGYTEGMYALALEPEAVKAFFTRFADFMIELVDLLMSYYPVNMLTIHDDWGTERDTFFSPKMMEELVFEPTKRIIEHIKSRGCAFMLHSCGNVSRFIPYMIDMNIDFLQMQRRAVDFPAMKLKYGDKIGFNAGIEGVQFGEKIDRDEMLQKIRHTVDVLGKGGGFYANIYEPNPELLWDYLCELHCYSREYYESN